MSFRSALVKPSQNSGRVGEQLFGVSNPATVAVTSGGSTSNVIDTITLGPGLWSIREMGAINLAVGAIVTICNFQLTAPGSISYIKTTEVLDVPALTAADIVQVTRDVVVKLDVETTLTLSATALYSPAASLSISRPPLNNLVVGGVGQYLTATKLA